MAEIVVVVVVVEAATAVVVVVVAGAVAVAVGVVVAVVGAGAVAVAVVGVAWETPAPRSPGDPCPRCKTFPTRYSILGGRGTRRTRTDAQF